MKAKLVKIRGRAAIVKYKDAQNVSQCIIIDSASLPGGKEFELDSTIIDTATPYGIDWSIVYPAGFVVTSADLQEALYEIGIYTLEDVLRGTPQVMEALRNLIRLNSAKLIKGAKHVLGG